MPASQPHNVMLVYYDDSLPAEVRYSRNVRRLAREGTTFTEAHLCLGSCSSARAELISGRWQAGPNAHGVVSNQARGHVWDIEPESLAPWIAAEGYEAGVIGNYFHPTQTVAGPAPGWSWWRGIADGLFNDRPGEYSIYDGTDTFEPGLHLTHYTTQEALRFITDRQTVPWFLWLAITPAHFPFRYTEWSENRWRGVHWPDVGDPDEDLTGKPSWIQAADPITDADLVQARRFQRRRLREITDADHLIGALFETLVSTGQWGRTNVIVSSDGGVHYGEHRRPNLSKVTPYRQSHHVPWIGWGPDFPSGVTVDAPVAASADIHATVLDIAGATPTRDIDGISLLDAAQDPAAYAASERDILGSRPERDIASEFAPAADWIMGHEGRVLMRHHDSTNYGDPDTGELDEHDRFELYDWSADPNELTNLAYDPDWSDVRDDLEARLDDMLGAAS